MHKKIAILLIFILSLNMFLTPQTNAAVVGKAVNQAAKKVAKEIVVDQAVQMSMNLVLDPKYRYEKKPDEAEPKQGYTMVCMPRDKKPDNTCAAPVQVKKDLTPADKKAIAQKAEINLDKKITGGIGATRWGKFIDWFIPTFAVGAGAAVISAALSGDLGNFFDDLALETLSEEFIVQSNNQNNGVSILNLFEKLNDTAQLNYYQNAYVIHYELKSGIDEKDYEVWDESYKEWNRLKTHYEKSAIIAPYPDHIIIRVNFGGYNSAEKNISLPDQSDRNSKENKSFATAIIGGFSDYPKVRKKSSTSVEIPPFPNFDETGLAPTKPPNIQRQVVAPGAIPFTKTDTGEVLIPYLKPDGTVGFKTSSGTIVDEKDITVGDPQITYNPDGSTTVSKAPTPTEQEQPEEEIPPPDKPPGTETDDPYDDPENPGNSCSESLKLPRLSALFRSFSTTFPFSLPFDLYRGFQALFAEIGSEKPAIEFSFFKGPTMDITIPDALDKYVPFLRSMLLFIFDVGLLYAIYRLIK